MQHMLVCVHSIHIFELFKGTFNFLNTATSCCRCYFLKISQKCQKIQQKPIEMQEIIRSASAEAKKRKKKTKNVDVEFIVWENIFIGQTYPNNEMKTLLTFWQNGKIVVVRVNATSTRTYVCTSMLLSNDALRWRLCEMLNMISL